MKPMGDDDRVRNRSRLERPGAMRRPSVCPEAEFHPAFPAWGYSPAATAWADTSWPEVARRTDRGRLLPPRPPGFDVGDTHAVNTGGTLVSGHVDPGSPHHIAADEFVEEGVEPTYPVPLGTAIQHALKGSNGVQVIDLSDVLAVLSALISDPTFSSCTNEAGALRSRQVVLPCPSSLLRPGDSLSATWHFRGSPVIDRHAPDPQGRERVGPLQFPRHPSDRSTSPSRSPSPPAPRSQAASMAFAKSTQARLPHFPGYPGIFTTLQTSFHNADRPVAPLRFDPGLSTGPESFTTGDLGVSPDRTFTGCLTRVIARLRHDHSFTVAVIAPEQLDARGSRFRFLDRQVVRNLGESWRCSF